MCGEHEAVSVLEPVTHGQPTIRLRRVWTDVEGADNLDVIIVEELRDGAEGSEKASWLRIGSINSHRIRALTRGVSDDGRPSYQAPRAEYELPTNPCPAEECQGLDDPCRPEECRGLQQDEPDTDAEDEAGKGLAQSDEAVQIADDYEYLHRRLKFMDVEDADHYAMALMHEVRLLGDHVAIYHGTHRPFGK